MTIARRGSRRIVVEQVSYRWSLRRRPTYSQGLGWSPLTFVAELFDNPGALLVVALPYAHPRNWLGLPSTAIRPATVVRGIHQALAAGWQPTQKGPVFRLTLDEVLR